MPLSEAQYRRIEHHLPTHRGNVSVTNLRVLNAVLYVAEHDCRWRQLPKRFGNWHTVYTRMNRWSRNGVLDRVFAELQRAGLLRVRFLVSADDEPVAGPSGLPAAEIRPPSRAIPQLVWLPRRRVRD